MKTRTANQLELGIPLQSLKRTLTASGTEVLLDYKTIGTAMAPTSAELPSKRKPIRPKQRSHPRNLTDMEELDPILGLASLIAETDPQVQPKTPDSSSLSGSEAPSKHRCLPKSRKPPLRKFSPGPLSRAATHAAIAYFIWSQKSSHSNCSISL